jgi:hypothetical protein
VQAIRVPWSGASFLVYLGGFTVLFAIGALLEVEADEHGAGGFVVWAALVFGVLAALAFLAKSSGHQITAGLLAFVSVFAFVIFVGSLWDWFGWIDDFELGFRGFHFAALVLELVLVVTAAVALRIFRFPLLVFVTAGSAWFFTTDLISNGGDWSAVVTIAIGLILLVLALGEDAGESRVGGFWLHVVAGLTIGGGFLWFFHEGDGDWILVGLAGLAYFVMGDRLARSSWIVLGAWGILQTASHFAVKWSAVGETFFPVFYLFPFVFSFDGGYSEEHRHPWAGPVIFAAAGALFIAVALVLARRRRDTIPAAGLL